MKYETQDISGKLPECNIANKHLQELQGSKGKCCCWPRSFAGRYCNNCSEANRTLFWPQTGGMFYFPDHFPTLPSETALTRPCVCGRKTKTHLYSLAALSTEAVTDAEWLHEEQSAFFLIRAFFSAFGPQTALLEDLRVLQLSSQHAFWEHVAAFWSVYIFSLVLCMSCKAGR